jgi:hypothetical protein
MIALLLLLYSFFSLAGDVIMPYGSHKTINYGSIFLEEKISYNQITEGISNEKISKDIQNILHRNKNYDSIAIPFELQYNSNSIQKHCRVILLDNNKHLMIVIGSSQARFIDHQQILGFIANKLGYQIESVVTHEQKPNMCINAAAKHMELISQDIPYSAMSKLFTIYNNDYSIPYKL